MAKKIIYAALCILSFYTFYSVIPLDVYDSFFYFLVIVGGVLTAGFLAAFLFSFKGATDETGKASNLGCVAMALIVVCFIGSSILFIYNDDVRERKELADYGVLVEATVVDGSSYSTRKADFTELTLEFFTEKGEKIHTDYSISKNEFDRFYQNQRIPIVYSSRHPQILKILRTSADPTCRNI